VTDPEIPVITPEAILAYLDGEELPHVAAYLQTSPEGATLAAQYQALQGNLARVLYRHDCPTTQQLGDYALRLPASADQVAIAAHVTTCPLCTGELAQVRAFLAIEADPPPLSIGERARRLVATLLDAPPLGAGAALRGGESGSTLTFRAEGFTITVDDFATGRRGYRSLVGLVEWPAPAPGDATVLLFAADGARRDEAIDETGNFVFDDLAAGEYRLEVLVGEDTVVIDGLRVGR
jgi:anti-sigma factor RsiW